MEVEIELMNKSLSKNEREILLGILRGEASAIHSYDLVLEDIPYESYSYQLNSIKSDHQKVVQYWKREILGLSDNEKLIVEPGLWDNIVETFIEVSKIIGPAISLKILIQGEKHGLSLYHQMMKDRKIGLRYKYDIYNEIIPRQVAHIEMIEKLIKSLSTQSK